MSLQAVKDLLDSQGSNHTEIVPQRWFMPEQLQNEPQLRP